MEIKLLLNLNWKRHGYLVEVSTTKSLYDIQPSFEGHKQADVKVFKSGVASLRCRFFEIWHFNLNVVTEATKCFEAAIEVDHRQNTFEI